MNVILSDIYGQSVKLNYQNIYDTLNQPYEGVAYVFAHDPKMVVIGRIKENGIWSITVEELYDNDIEDTPLQSIYAITFKDDETDAAIKLFISLIKSQRKDFVRHMRKKLGKYVILTTPIMPPKGVNVQKYLYEILHNNVKRSINRRRFQSASRKTKTSR